MKKMKNKEVPLSEKRKDSYTVEDLEEGLYRGKDVTEFIRRLKKLLKEGKIKDAWGYYQIQGDWDGLISKIDALAGDKLTGVKK